VRKEGRKEASKQAKAMAIIMGEEDFLVKP
jgi:hypothetical protein